MERFPHIPRVMDRRRLLDAVRRVQAETGGIFSVDFTERFEVRATTRAGQLVAA